MYLGPVAESAIFPGTLGFPAINQRRESACGVGDASADPEQQRDRWKNSWRKWGWKPFERARRTRYPGESADGWKSRAP